MPSKFNIVRGCIYGLVILWTVICLAIAVHFQGMLVSSDLTRFVPFAIFVCAVSLLIFLLLLGFTIRRDRNPITTRIELPMLGLAGTLWLALGAFLVSSESQNADVECYSSEDLTTTIDVPDFSTDTYHAQYRVLEAFSLFNVILIGVFGLFLLALAVKHHYRSHKAPWSYPVTTYPWFGTASNSPSKDKMSLPSPVTARHRSHSRSPKGPSRGPSTRHIEKSAPLPSRPSPRRERDLPSSQRTPPKAHTTDKYTRNGRTGRSVDRHDTFGRSDRVDKWGRDASPRR
ncbi:hypothetical protein JAAARDRAFT_52463 [Jaapia argillacea MUCL 33604]|uniref:MARVEL domain-containing protein n=1 Tax=Jaapia argillacea MUCL 33604 TaxID=933084 RepID=A0A067QEC6_9AGAM|nr:hypothetical protein JAAARDRAFT_52463 [Jaapia argillacea MUCL 33604]